MVYAPVLVPESALIVPAKPSEPEGHEVQNSDGTNHL